ncbi:hypothetical protein FCH79_17185 [Pseudomonas koreensis]|nr:hypothetical protein [Pseudomonas koreensis]
MGDVCHGCCLLGRFPGCEAICEVSCIILVVWADAFASKLAPTGEVRSTVGASLLANGGAADNHSPVTLLTHPKSFSDGFFCPSD